MKLIIHFCSQATEFRNENLQDKLAVKSILADHRPPSSLLLVYKWKQHHLEYSIEKIDTPPSNEKFRHNMKQPNLSHTHFLCSETVWKFSPSLFLSHTLFPLSLSLSPSLSLSLDKTRNVVRTDGRPDNKGKKYLAPEIFFVDVCRFYLMPFTQFYTW